MIVIFFLCLDRVDTRDVAKAVESGMKPQTDGSLNERRESGVSEEEREEARQFRHKALKKGGS